MRRAGSPNYSGSVLQNQFCDSMRRASCLTFRIPDSTFVIKGGQMGSRPSPADYFTFVRKDGVVHIVLVECKAEGGKNIRFDRLKLHQQSALSEIDAMDALSHGVVAVNFYDAEDVREMNRLFMCPVGVWAEKAVTLSRKSLPMKECEDDVRIVECIRVGTSWDMSPFLASL
jgi:hypothetical protein